MKTILITLTVFFAGMMLSAAIATTKPNPVLEELDDWDVLLAANETAGTEPGAPPLEPPQERPRALMPAIPEDDFDRPEWDRDNIDHRPWGPGNRYRQKHRSMGRGMSHGKGGGMDRGISHGKGGGMDRGMGRGMDYRNPMELLEFLEEHEPGLAERLEQMHDENPEQLFQRLPALMKLYGPVMRQMAEHPEQGRLSLKRIRQRLKVEQAIRKYKSEKEPSQEDRVKLSEQLRILYEIIMEQEKLRLATWEKRLDKLAEYEQKLPAKTQEEAKAQETTQAKERELIDKPYFTADMTDDAEPKTTRLTKRIERHQRKLKKQLDKQKKSLQHWQEKSQDIISHRIDQLLGKHRPFPWGR